MLASSRIGFLIQHLASSMGRQNDQILQEQLGIGFSQFKLMKVLQVESGVQQKQIADALGQTEASISRQIKLLQEKGLLQVEVSPHNRREHITTLTAKGLRFGEEAKAIIADYHREMFAALSEKQQEQFADILSIMHKYSCQGKTSICQKFTSRSIEN